MKILIIGQGGCGKSSLANVLYNGKVNVPFMTTPAEVSAASNGVTNKTSTYIVNANEVIVDTIGFSDSENPPDVLIENMRAVFVKTRMEFTHILFVVPFGRISRATQLSLGLIETLFGPLFREKAIVVITKCDTSRNNIETYLRVNSDANDNRVVSFIRDVYNSDPERVVTGSLLYDDDILLDQERKFYDIRYDFFLTLTTVLKKRTDAIKPIATTFKEFIQRFLEYIQSIFMGVFRSVRSTAGAMFEIFRDVSFVDDFDIFLPECPICLTSSYPSDNTAVYSKVCGHLFHKQCLEEWQLTKESCPYCRQSCLPADITFWEPSESVSLIFSHFKYL